MLEVYLMGVDDSKRNSCAFLHKKKVNYKIFVPIEGIAQIFGKKKSLDSLWLCKQMTQKLNCFTVVIVILTLEFRLSWLCTMNKTCK